MINNISSSRNTLLQRSYSRNEEEVATDNATGVPPLARSVQADIHTESTERLNNVLYCSVCLAQSYRASKCLLTPAHCRSNQGSYRTASRTPRPYHWVNCHLTIWNINIPVDDRQAIGSPYLKQSSRDLHTVRIPKRALGGHRHSMHLSNARAEGCPGRSLCRRNNPPEGKSSNKHGEGKELKRVRGFEREGHHFTHQWRRQETESHVF